MDLLPDVGFACEGQPGAAAKAVVDAEGRLIIPVEIARRLGLVPGASVPIESPVDALVLHRPASSLAKVYLEPTSRCNLRCRTCIRNAWDEPLGSMSAATFRRVLAGLREFDPKPLVFFGGFGEPLAHPRIGSMVAQVKVLGGSVELITNGILLDEQRGQQLIEAGLDRLWVSLDGATPEGYTDVRLAEALPKILENLTRFQEASLRLTGRMTELGVAFVAMKRNISELPTLIHLSRRIGATRYLVTNLLPYTREHGDEILYQLTLDKSSGFVSSFSPVIDLPRIDINESTQGSLLKVLRVYSNVRLEGIDLNQTVNRCPFIQRGATAIRWDGELSPCLALLHSHTSYLSDRERKIKRFTLGNIGSRSLIDLWEDPQYVSFRQRVQEFDFSPCTQCGTCDLAERNEEDCFGNTFPTCGGCLWAQGVIRCP